MVMAACRDDFDHFTSAICDSVRVKLTGSVLNDNHCK